MRSAAFPIEPVDLDRRFVAVLHAAFRAQEFLTGVEERDALARQHDRRGKPVHRPAFVVRGARRGQLDFVP
ncbi:hypothetical protein D3C76_156400 [compost metagenome]